tara:strand:- start:1074 stop:1847 length:774 start_codon:yes stop_codon:yes gene_type:complete
MAIRADSVTIHINGTKLLSDMSLEVVPGEVVALVGPNGAGKSTFLSVLAGDLAPSAGMVSYDRRNVSELTFKQRAKYRSVMSQAAPMVFDFTVKDIVDMGWVYRDHGVHVEQFQLAVQQTIAICDIAPLLRRRFNTLSGGEQKRVHFARALLQLWRPENHEEPRYLLLDEPLASLDIKHEIGLLRVIREAATSGLGVLIVLHNLNLAAKFADKIALLNKGKIVGLGAPEAVLSTQSLSSVYGVPVTVQSHPLTISYF